MRSDKMDIEDLLSDESFINYCKKSSPGDIAKWNSYSRESADHAMLVENAEASFMELFNAIADADRDEQEARLINRINIVESASIVQMQGYEKKGATNIYAIMLKLTAAAAVLLMVIFFSTNYTSSAKKESLKTFVAAYGERKNFQLPDGSIVLLNAGSKINIDESYGTSDRVIYLEGEAFFDVKHNTELPFIVRTPAMDVLALGTAFNVKAYPGEKITETSLVRGLVEITLKNEHNRKVLLHPNQKVHWENLSEKPVINSFKTKGRNSLGAADSLIETLITSDAGNIKEIAWKENKLIFEDETFADLAILLERWYGVKITFADESIQQYRFTGIFEKEKLITVFSILKESKNFHYAIIPGDTLKINISK